MHGFIYGVVATVIVVLALMNLHIVYHGDTVTVHQKDKTTLELTYVNVDNLDPASYAKLSSSARKAIANQKINRAKKEINKGIDKLQEAFGGGK